MKAIAVKPIEVWKDIPNYEGLYQASIMGNIRSRHSGEWQVINHFPNAKGYRQLSLTKDKIQTCHKVHRLMGQAFLKREKHHTQINHKDKVVDNNHLDNLEWCDNMGNIKHRLDILYWVRDPTGYVYSFYNAAEVCRKYRLNSGNFSQMLNGKRKSCQGWRLF